MKNAAGTASGSDAHHLILQEPAGRADASRSPISSRRRSGPALAERTVSLSDTPQPLAIFPIQPEIRADNDSIVQIEHAVHKRRGDAKTQFTESFGFAQAGRYAEYDVLLLCVNNVW